MARHGAWISALAIGSLASPWLMAAWVFFAIRNMHGLDLLMYEIFIFFVSLFISYAAAVICVPIFFIFSVRGWVKFYHFMFGYLFCTAWVTLVFSLVLNGADIRELIDSPGVLAKMFLLVSGPAAFNMLAVYIAYRVLSASNPSLQARPP